MTERSTGRRSEQLRDLARDLEAAGQGVYWTFNVDQVRTALAEIERLREALRAHQAWADADRAGPDYGTLTRATHPRGEDIWSRWWRDQLELCDLAQRLTRAALAEDEDDVERASTQEHE